MFNLFKKIQKFYKPQIHPHVSYPRIPIECSVELNIQTLQEMFDNSGDLTIKRMNLKLADGNIAIAVITMEGMIDKETLAASVTNPISMYDKFSFSNGDVFSLIEKDIITVTHVATPCAKMPMIFDGLSFLIKRISFCTK